MKFTILVDHFFVIFTISSIFIILNYLQFPPTPQSIPVPVVIDVQTLGNMRECLGATIQDLEYFPSMIWKAWRVKPPSAFGWHNVPGLSCSLEASILVCYSLNPVAYVYCLRRAVSPTRVFITHLSVKGCKYWPLLGTQLIIEGF